MADLRDMEAVRSALRHAEEPQYARGLASALLMPIGQTYAALVGLYDLGLVRIVLGSRDAGRSANAWELVPIASSDSSGPKAWSAGIRLHRPAVQSSFAMEAR